MLQDIRYALRSLRQYPGVTAVAVLCLSLGIGVNATIFSTVDGVLLQPFSFADPERIVAIRGRNQNAGISRMDVSYKDLLDLQAQARTSRRSRRASRRSTPPRTPGGRCSPVPFEMSSFRNRYG
jgi:hypothetical protein